jgi:hypothetical protein
MRMAHSRSGSVKSRSKSIVQAIDRLACPSGVIERPSKSVVDALDKLAVRIGPFRSLSNAAIGPNQQVFALYAEGLRKLHGKVPPDQNTVWYYDLVGSFFDATGEIPGTGKLESVLSWVTSQVGPVVFDFPPASLAGPPYNEPPTNGYKGVNTHADTLGVTKTRLEFPDGSTLVSLGVNQTKLKPHPDGSADLYETNTEVISTGSGRFAGASGLITSDLGGFFKPLTPLDPSKDPYKSGYPVKVFIFIRLATKP